MSLSDYDKAWCSRLLDELTRWGITAPFRKPVDPDRDHAPNYREIVKNPMDFQQMKRKLSTGDYSSVDAFISDIQLICDNAKLFNGAASMYGLICDDIMAEVHKQMSEKPASAEEEWYRSLNKAIKALNEHMAEAPADISLCQEDIPMPNITALSSTKVSQIENEIGEKIGEFEKRWVFLNETTKKKIVEIIKSAE